MTRPRRERVLLADFIEEVEVAATIEAKARGLQLTVTPVPQDASVEVDRQILAAAVANLLQNAFKFTRPAGHVLKSCSGTSLVLENSMLHDGALTCSVTWSPAARRPSGWQGPASASVRRPPSG